MLADEHQLMSVRCILAKGVLLIEEEQQTYLFWDHVA
jgi:hypothetical protein